MRGNLPPCKNQRRKQIHQFGSNHVNQIWLVSRSCFAAFKNRAMIRIIPFVIHHHHKRIAFSPIGTAIPVQQQYTSCCEECYDEEAAADGEHCVALRIMVFVFDDLVGGLRSIIIIARTCLGVETTHDQPHGTRRGFGLFIWKAPAGHFYLWIGTRRSSYGHHSRRPRRS